jgi:hypothetical protein
MKQTIANAIATPAAAPNAAIPASAIILWFLKIIYCFILKFYFSLLSASHFITKQVAGPRRIQIEIFGSKN